MSLRLKILLPLVSLASLLVGYVYGYWMPHSLVNIEEGSLRSIERHLDSVSEGLVPLLLGHQLDTIYENLDSLMEKNSDWISLRLLAADRRPLYPLATMPPVVLDRSREKDIHIIERPIRYFDTELGSLILTVDFAPRLTDIRKRHWELMFVMLAIIVIFSAAAGFVVDRLVRRPVNLLARASQRLAEGDFDVPLIKAGDDEVGILVDSFEDMRKAVREYRATRRQAEKALSERAMLAELSADIGYCLTMQGELRRILQACAEVMVRHLDVAFARIWVLNAAEQVLELRASAGMYTRVDGSHSRVPVGKFKIGLIALEREPHVTNAVIGDVRVHDQEWAKRERMVAFAGHPLMIDDKLVGVMAMFSRNPLTDVTRKALASVSNEIAIGIERKLAEEDLKRMNERFSLATNAARLGVWDWNIQKNEMVWDDMMYALYGIDRQGGVSAYEAWLTRVHPDDRVRCGEISKRALSGDGEYDTEFRVVWPDGSIHYLKAFGQVVRGDDGSPLRMTGIHLDISERKRAEEERLASEIRFRAVFESSVDAIGVSKAGMHVFVNPAYLALFGYRSNDELQGRSILDLIALDEHPAILENIRRRTRGEAVPSDYETRGLRKDGSVFDMDVHASTYELAGETYTLVVLRDISARKQTETALRMRERELRESQRLAHIGSWDWDAVNDIIWWSDEYYRIYGFDPKEPPPNYEEHLKAYTPEGAVRLNAAVKRAMEFGEPYEVDLELSHPTESTQWVTARSEAKRDSSGRIRGLRGTSQNITERKRADQKIQRAKEDLEQRFRERTADVQKKSEELQANQMALMNIVEDLNDKTTELERANDKLKELDQLKSMFIASMSHELRTPLNSIIGFSSIMLNEWTGPLTAEQKENLAAMLRSGKHLLSLVNDVIDVSKIEAGKIESVVEDFDIRDVVLEAIETLKKEIEKKGLKLEVCAPRLTLQGDRRRLLQCLLNVVSNAMKYTKQGSISVSAELSADGSMITVAVEDTGIGIREEDLKKLFSPFVRLAPPQGSIIPGTGLGLYLTRKLVREVLKGDILVSSTYGSGSRFSLRVPVAGEGGANCEAYLLSRTTRTT